MTFQPGANLYTAGFGTRPENVEVPHIDVRPPAATDVLYPLGKQWLDTVGRNTYFLVNLSSSSGITTAVWEKMQNASGSLDGLSDGTTDVFADGLGIIQLVGTGEQINVLSDPPFNALIFSLPNSVIFPGSVEFNQNVVFSTTSNSFVDSGAIFTFDNTPGFNLGLNINSGVLTVRSGANLTVSPGAVADFGNLPDFNGGLNLNAGTLTVASGAAISVASGAGTNFGNTPAFNNGFVVPGGTVNIQNTTVNTAISSPIVTIGTALTPQISNTVANFTLNSNNLPVNISTDSTTSVTSIGGVSSSASSTTISAGTGGITLASGTIYRTFHTTNPTNTLVGNETLVAANTLSGAIAIDLVLSPVGGTHLVIYDAGGNAAVNNITINATGGFLFHGNGTFNGTATLTINQDYGSVELYYSDPFFISNFWMVAFTNYAF